MSAEQKEAKNDLLKIEEELEDWMTFQNGVIGVLSFSFALTCFSLKGGISIIASTLSLLMIVSLSSVNAPKASETLRTIRAKKDKTKNDIEIIGFVQKNFLSNFRYLSFNIGFGTLSLTWIYFIITELPPLLK